MAVKFRSDRKDFLVPALRVGTNLLMGSSPLALAAVNDGDLLPGEMLIEYANLSLQPLMDEY